jgi:hypothetical protein
VHFSQQWPHSVVLISKTPIEIEHPKVKRGCAQSSFLPVSLGSLPLRDVSLGIACLQRLQRLRSDRLSNRTNDVGSRLQGVGKLAAHRQRVKDSTHRPKELGSQKLEHGSRGSIRLGHLLQPQGCVDQELGCRRSGPLDLPTVRRASDGVTFANGTSERRQPLFT